MFDKVVDPLTKQPIAVELGRRLQVVALRMNNIIDRQNFPPTFLPPLMLALHEPSKLLQSSVASGTPLGSDDRNLWSLAVVVAHAAASGSGIPGAHLASWRAMIPIAVAAEFLGLSLDIIDDIQDGDSALVKSLGVPVALNIALALLELTNAAIDDRYTPVLLRAHLHEMFTSAILTATGGQFLDLSYEQNQQAISIADALDMTARKSGTLFGLLYQAGAFVGAYMRGGIAQAKVISEGFGEFGRAVGIIAQLANDERDAQFSATNHKSDRERAKKTLPLVFEREAFAKGESSVAEVRESSLRFMRYMSDIYRIQALDTLDRLTTLYTIRPGTLRWLISDREVLS